MLKICTAYIDHSVESNDNDPKFKVGGHVGVSKCKSIFAKNYHDQNWSKKFMTKKGKNTVNICC